MQCGNVAMWECGNVGIWKCGNFKTTLGHQFDKRRLILMIIGMSSFVLSKDSCKLLPWLHPRVAYTHIETTLHPTTLQPYHHWVNYPTHHFLIDGHGLVNLITFDQVFQHTRSFYYNDPITP